jgi:hypothetical protein
MSRLGKLNGTSRNRAGIESLISRRMGKDRYTEQK